MSIPSGLGTFLEKMIFFAQGTLVDPPLALPVQKFFRAESTEIS